MVAEPYGVIQLGTLPRPDEVADVDGGDVTEGKKRLLNAVAEDRTTNPTPPVAALLI